MGSISVKDARNELAEVLNKAAYGKERIFLTRHGKNVAAIVPVEDVQLLEHLEDRMDLAEARKALAEAGRNISLEELKSEFRMAPARGGVQRAAKRKRAPNTQSRNGLKKRKDQRRALPYQTARHHHSPLITFHCP